MFGAAMARRAAYGRFRKTQPGVPLRPSLVGRGPFCARHPTAAPSRGRRIFHAPGLHFPRSDRPCASAAHARRRLSLAARRSDSPVALLERAYSARAAAWDNPPMGPPNAGLYFNLAPRAGTLFVVRARFVRYISNLRRRSIGHQGAMPAGRVHHGPLRFRDHHGNSTAVLRQPYPSTGREYSDLAHGLRPESRCASS